MRVRVRGREKCNFTDKYPLIRSVMVEMKKSAGNYRWKNCEWVKINEKGILLSW